MNPLFSFFQLFPKFPSPSMASINKPILCVPHGQGRIVGRRSKYLLDKLKQNTHTHTHTHKIIYHSILFPPSSCMAEFCPGVTCWNGYPFCPNIAGCDNCSRLLLKFSPLAFLFFFFPNSPLV